MTTARGAREWRASAATPRTRGRGRALALAVLGAAVGLGALASGCSHARCIRPEPLTHGERARLRRVETFLSGFVRPRGQELLGMTLSGRLRNGASPLVAASLADDERAHAGGLYACGARILDRAALRGGGALPAAVHVTAHALYDNLPSGEREVFEGLYAAMSLGKWEAKRLAEARSQGGLFGARPPRDVALAERFATLIEGATILALPLPERLDGLVGAFVDTNLRRVVLDHYTDVADLRALDRAIREARGEPTGEGHPGYFEEGLYEGVIARCFSRAGEDPAARAHHREARPVFAQRVRAPEPRPDELFHDAVRGLATLVTVVDGKAAPDLTRRRRFLDTFVRPQWASNIYVNVRDIVSAYRLAGIDTRSPSFQDLLWDRRELAEGARLQAIAAGDRALGKRALMEEVQLVALLASAAAPAPGGGAGTISQGPGAPRLAATSGPPDAASQEMLADLDAAEQREVGFAFAVERGPLGLLAQPPAVIQARAGMEVFPTPIVEAALRDGLGLGEAYREEALLLARLLERRGAIEPGAAALVADPDRGLARLDERRPPESLPPPSGPVSVFYETPFFAPRGACLEHDDDAATYLLVWKHDALPCVHVQAGSVRYDGYMRLWGVKLEQVVEVGADGRRYALTGKRITPAHQRELEAILDTVEAIVNPPEDG